MKKALILVDLQNDFCPGGALAVAEGDQLIPMANALMPHFDLVLATQDWHPANHGSFAANHPWRKPGQVIDLDGLPQVLWPIHCVEESFGAEFVKGLNLEGINKVFRKGNKPNIDSYSGFFDNGKRQSTGLGDYLRAESVEAVYVMGLATDYCVKYTALDAKSLGFDTFLIYDACRGVNLQPNDVELALAELEAAGVVLVEQSKILAG